MSIRPIYCFVLIVIFVLSLRAEADSYQNLQKVIETAKAGTVIRLPSGTYSKIIINKPITIIGSEDTVIDGGYQGNVITINASNVSIKNLTIRNSGSDVAKENAGIYISEDTGNTLVEGNRLEDNSFGISLHGTSSPTVRNNSIQGRKGKLMSDIGDGIRLWNVTGGLISNNEIEFGRDGIFITISESNILESNRMENLRFAIHYMYAHNNKVSNNYSANNDVAFALMFSNNLVISGNQSYQDRSYGIMLNYVNNSSITDNMTIENKDKCLFVYNSSKNVIRGNHFKKCNIGIHYTAGSYDNLLYENNFIDNYIQVKYVGTRYNEWSHGKVGNYWSDNISSDLNGDSIADITYRPNNIADKIMWKYPEAKLLFSSPALQLLRRAQALFPNLYPGGVVDSYPLMQQVEKGTKS